MTTIGKRISSSLLPGLALVLAAGTASADRPHYRADGSVKVGTHVFATGADYYASSLFKTSGARCGTPKEPAVSTLAETDCNLNQTVINSEYDDDRTLVIQVVFHVIKRTDGTGAVTPALLQSQIDILNEDFDAIMGTPGSAGHNTKLQFVMARFDPSGNPTPGYEVVTNNSYFNDPGGSPNAMKQALHWDTSRYLNMYTNDAAGFLGYATFPSEEAGGVEDGVVLLYNAVGRNSPGGPPYDQGRTATHEVGHYLGLLHTFEGGCGSTGAPYTTGDLISDTQREADAVFGCPAPSSSCGGGNDPIQNYMDYTDDTCMTKFTAEQGNRIRCSIMNFRTVNTAPTAQFTSSVAGNSVDFTNTSTDPESTLAQLHSIWTFGDGQTSTTASPTHNYASAGTYTVQLEIVDPGSGTDTVTHMVVTVGGGLPDAAPPPPDAHPPNPDAHPPNPDAHPGDPDARETEGPDADPGNPGDGDGGGCCRVHGGDTSFFLCGIPVAFVLVRKRRRRARR